MKFFRDLSIRNKLIAIILFSTILTIGTGFAFVVRTEIRTFKKDMAENTVLNTRILGEYCVTPLAFYDRNGAEDILARMQVLTSIEDVLLFDESGDLFAAYHRSGDGSGIFPPGGTAAVEFKDGFLHVSQPISYRGENYGNIYVRSATDQLDRKILDYISTMLIGMVILIFLSSFLANILQRLISKPILALADTTRIISISGDYSTRVERRGFDEVGLLYDEFNNMLDQIETREQERDAATAALDAEKDRLKVTLRAIGDAVIATGTDCRIVLMNRIAEKLTGWSQVESIGKHLDEVITLLNDKTRNRCKSPAGSALESARRTSVPDNTILVSKNGDEKFVSGSSAPISDEKGAIIGVILVLRDITSLKGMQERLLRHEKLAALGQLSGSVGHELRNPLGAIRNTGFYLKMVLADAPGKVKEHLAILDRQVVTADGIISNLLDFSRIKSPETVSVSSASLIEKAVRESDIPPGVAARVETLPEPVDVDVDPTQINQVLLNLIQNSVQAMPEGGELSLTTRKEKKYIVISITDTGCGISEKNLTRIFEPLFTTKVKGFGFGMALCKNLVEANEGEITVESEVEKGTMVFVRLPIASV